MAIKKNHIIYSLAIIIATIIIVLIYTFNAPREDISSNNTDFAISTEKIIAEFEEDEINAEEKYKNLILEINGVISEINNNQDKGTNCILKSEMMSSVICEFEPGNDKTIRKYKVGDSIIIKGKFSGYLMDIILNTCSVKK